MNFLFRTDILNLEDFLKGGVIMPEQELSVIEILAACCLKENNQHTANTAVIISTGECKEDTAIQLDTKATFMRANFKFERYGDVLTVDIYFQNANDSNLLRCYQLLQENTQKLQQLNEKSDVYPTIQFSFIPIELKGKYHVVMANPIAWELCSDNLKELPTRIRITFMVDDILGFQNHDLNYNAIVAEIKARERQEAFYEQEEEKKRKRDAYEAEFGPKFTQGRSYL